MKSDVEDLLGIFEATLQIVELLVFEGRFEFGGGRLPLLRKRHETREVHSRHLLKRFPETRIEIRNHLRWPSRNDFEVQRGPWTQLSELGYERLHINAAITESRLLRRRPARDFINRGVAEVRCHRVWSWSAVPAGGFQLFESSQNATRAASTRIPSSAARRFTLSRYGGWRLPYESERENWIAVSYSGN